MPTCTKISVVVPSSADYEHSESETATTEVSAASSGELVAKPIRALAGVPENNLDDQKLS